VSAGTGVASWRAHQPRVGNTRCSRYWARFVSTALVHRLARLVAKASFGGGSAERLRRAVMKNLIDELGFPARRIQPAVWANRLQTGRWGSYLVAHGGAWNMITFTGSTAAAPRNR